MDYKEEQEQELEILESIYPDELEIVKNEYPNVEFLIQRLPLEFIPKDSSSFTTESIGQNHFLNITFKFPETYPDCLPEINVEAIKQKKKQRRRRRADSDDEYDDEDYDDEYEEEEEEESDDEDEDDDEEEQEYDDHGNPIVSKLLDLPGQVELEDSEFLNEFLNVKLPAQLEEDMMVGMPMVFNVVTLLKEECEQYLTETLDNLEIEHDKMLKLKEEEEQKKFQGTKVNAESFKKWKENFKREMGIDVRDKKRQELLHQGKLSGKEIFEQGLAGEGDDEAEE